MPYDPRTGRMITDEQAERLAEEAGRPAPPPRPEEEPGWTERLGDAAFKGISTALRFTQKFQGVLSGQEALSRRPIEQFTGWDAPDFMELGTRINLGMTPLAWPKEFKSPIMEAIGLPVRPVAAVVSPTLEYLRRIRMGEETDSLKWGQEFARGLFRGPQDESVASKLLMPYGDWTPGGALLKQFKPEWLEPPESDRFRAGYELLTGQREGQAGGWTGAAGLLAGEAGELLPMLPLLLISRGPASTRGMQRVGARAATRTGRYLFDSARRAANSGADVSVVEGMVKASKEAPGVFRSLSDSWYGQRRTLAENIRSSMREGRGTALDRALRDFVEGDALLKQEAEQALIARGVPEQAARAAARGFANEIIWGAEDGWRLAGVRLGRRPTTSMASRLRSGAQTTAGRSAAEMRGVSEYTGIADVTGARSALTRTMEEMGLREQNPVWSEAEPVRSQAVINAEYYLKPRSVRATEASEAARISVLETMEAGPQSAAKVRAEAVLRENLSGAVKRLRFNEEAQADLMGRAPAAEAAPAEAPTLPTDLPADAFGRGTVTAGPRGDVGALAAVAGRFGLERPEASLLEPMETPAAPAQQAPVEALEQTYGTTTDAADAAFLLPDGRMIRRRPGLTPWAHPDMLREVTGKPSFEGVANETGMVRMGIDVDPASGSRALRVEMWSKPTEQQIRALQQAAKEADRIDVDMRGGVRAEADWSADPVLPTSMVDLSRAIEEFWPAAPAQQEAPGASASVVEGTSLPPAPEEAPRGAQAAQPTPEQAEADSARDNFMRNLRSMRRTYSAMASELDAHNAAMQEQIAALKPITKYDSEAEALADKEQGRLVMQLPNGEWYRFATGKGRAPSDYQMQQWAERWGVVESTIERRKRLREQIQTAESEGAAKGYDVFAEELAAESGSRSVNAELHDLQQDLRDTAAEMARMEEVKPSAWTLTEVARYKELDAQAKELNERRAAAERAMMRRSMASQELPAEATSEQPQEVVSSPQNVVEAAALPQPGERVVMREARTGREEVGQVVADPETGEPLVAAAADGTPIVSFEREDGTTTWVPWVADESIVSFEQAPQEAPVEEQGRASGVEAWVQFLDEVGSVHSTREGWETGLTDKMKFPYEALTPDEALSMLRALIAEGALENQWGDVAFVPVVRQQLRDLALSKKLPSHAYVAGALKMLVDRATETVSVPEREVFGGGPDWSHQWQWSLLDAPQEAPAPVEAPSASEALNIPPPPPVLADDAARAAVNRNIRALNAALDHVLPQLARMVETHDPASATAVAATQAIRVATTARNEAQAATDAPTDALAEIVAQVSGASDARARTAAEDAVAEVMVVAEVLSEQLQAALVEQGVPVPEAQAAGRRASAGYLLLHEATLREGDRWTDAMEGLAAVQEGMEPQTLEDLQGREALKQAALREAFRTLGEEPALPELEQFTLEAPGPEATSREQAHAMLDDGEVLPGEPPIVTVAREAVEQVGGEFTPDMAEIAREAELERLKVEASRLQREIEGYTEGYASYNDNLQAEFDRQLSQHMESERRSKAEADSKQDTEQIVEAARSLKPYVLKYPDVRTELKPTLAVLETETLGMLTAIHHRLLGIYERPRGQAALSREERAILTWLSAATQKGASARDQLRIVLGEAVAEAVIEQGAIKPDGTLDFDKLPRTERRIFEAHAERREFYDDIREGRKGLPSFKQLSERLYDYRHYGDTGEPSPRPEAIEDYLPQFTIHAQGPEDLEWLRDVFTLEWMTAKQQPQVRNRYERLGLLENKQEGLREPRREDIVRKRHYPTIYDKMGDMVEIAEKYGVDPGTVEVDTLIQDTVYLHQFGALRTAVGVYEWIHEYGDKAMDVQMDPALGPEVAQQMMNEGWGAPRPFGLELPGTEGFLLPPPVQGALNGIIAKGTLTPIIDQVILRKIMPPVKKLFWSMSMVPLQTITFLGTQFVELFSNVFASGAANPLRWKSLFEGYALANRVLARQIMGIAESCPPTTWAAEMKLAHARTQENLWAALMKRYKLTPDDIQTLQDIVKRHNIVEGSVGAQAHEHLERMLGTLNLHAKEIQAISHGIMSMVFGIDTFARTWSICSLVAQGYTGDEAGKMTRESSANYDLKTPIYGLLSSWAFYSTWLMQRAEQAASLTYKRPGVLYLFAQLEEDKERLLGFSAGWQPLVEAGLWWAVDDPTVMPLKSGHPLRAEIDQFLAGTEFLEEEDGYQMFYAPFRLPLLDIIGTGRSFVNRPGETLMEMAVPAVRGLAEVESGSGKASSLLREMPGVGPWARAADRFPEEVMPRLTASVGPMQLALADPPEEFWAGVVDAGETPRAAQATPAQWKKAKRQVEMGVPRSQTDAGRYEVEKMQFLYLLEKAKRRTGVPIYAGGVPEAVNLLTPEGIERVIEAIDAGEWIVSKPSETPQQFRKRLEEELGERRPEEAGKAPQGPMTPDEQRGGIAATVSRMLRPVTMEGVTP